MMVASLQSEATVWSLGTEDKINRRLGDARDSRMRTRESAADEIRSMASIRLNLRGMGVCMGPERLSLRTDCGETSSQPQLVADLGECA
jgi:hypothetical protein